MKTNSPVFRLYTALNAMAATVWVFLLFEMGSRTRIALADYGAAIGLIALFFALPAGAVAIWWLRKRSPHPDSNPSRRYVLASTVFLAGSWLVSCMPALFWGGLLWHGLTHAWPIALREGPDTAFAGKKFREHFGFAAPRSVRDLHCRQGWEFGDGNTYRMKFHFEDATVVEQIVSALRLEPVPEGEPAAWTIESSHPNWWPSPSAVRYQQVFRAGSSPRLWVDRENRVAYYRSWP